MRIPDLRAIRWFREAKQTLPTQRYAGQSTQDRCREAFAEEVQWFSEAVARAAKRRE